MAKLELFGTLTSPYVRRVRIVAAELGLEYEWIDAATEAGQQALRQSSPIWKIPIARIHGQLVLDSAAICQTLLHLHGPGPLAPYDPHNLEFRNIITVIDGAVDSLINTFYLKKDGVDAAQAAYLQKQHHRAAAALAWLDQRANGPFLSNQTQLGLAEIALVTSLNWMTFRNTYDVSRHPALTRLVEHYAERPSFSSTLPPRS